MVRAAASQTRSSAQFRRAPRATSQPRAQFAAMPLALRALTLAALLSLALGAASETCPKGQHADPLVTYILTAEKATL